MMRIIAQLAIALVVLWTSPSLATRTDKLVILIVDDSGAAAQLNPEDQQAIKQTLVWQTSKVRMDGWGRAHTLLISVHDPRVLWSGMIREIKRQGPALAGMLGANGNACADLVGALSLAVSSIVQHNPSEVVLFIVSPLIHAPECDGKVSLPQPVPPDAPLKALALPSISLAFLAAHHLQQAAWSQALRDAGATNAKVLGIAESKALLRGRGIRDVF